MARNIELKEIRENKRKIYKGVRVLLSRGRKTGCEYGNLDLEGFSEKEIANVNVLCDYLWGEDINFLRENNGTNETFKDLLNMLIIRGYSDDVCQFTYKVDRVGDDTIYVILFKDKYSNKYDRVDIFIVNSKGEKR